MQIQNKHDLDAFYAAPDPWGYEDNPHDDRRRLELLSALPRRQYRRCLDIGCGDGFVTFSLPGDEIVGVDVSEKAIEWARQRATKATDASRFRFEHSSLFELSPKNLGRFDLIVITGVLYEQYIGKGSSVVRSLIDELLKEGGILASCHIRDWLPPRFPYAMLDMTLYPYREYTHQLEVYKK